MVIGRHARREAEADTATRRTRTVDAARKTADKVCAQPDRWTVADRRRSVSLRVREVWDDALDDAFAQGWVSEQPEPGQGRRQAEPASQEERTVRLWRPWPVHTPRVAPTGWGT
jgi:hypothetical protein